MLDCKTWMLCNLSDMFAWAYGIQKLKRVQIPKKNLKKKEKDYYYTPHTREGFWSQSTANSKQEIGKQKKENINITQIEP